MEAGLSPSNSFVQIVPLKEGTIKAGDKAHFKIRSTLNGHKFTYQVRSYINRRRSCSIPSNVILSYVCTCTYLQVMSRGTMLLSGTVTASGEEAAVAFDTTPEMAPKARLIVYAIRSDNKEIVVDAADFKVDGLFKNKVSLLTSLLGIRIAHAFPFRPASR